MQASEETALVPSLSKTCKGFLWDSAASSNAFIAFDDKVCTEYHFVKYSVAGKQVVSVGETSLLSDQRPILLCDGDVSLATSDGSLSSMSLQSHIHSPSVDLKDQLKLLIKMRRFGDAWEACKSLGGEDGWNDLGMAAISDLNIAFGNSNPLTNPFDLFHSFIPLAVHLQR